jgi:hypothetical protein
MKIGPFTFTRDSALWWYGLVAALLGAVATFDAEMAATFGIAAVWLPKIRLLSFLIGVGSAWARTSPFPHSQDGGRADPSKLTQ